MFPVLLLVLLVALVPTVKPDQCLKLLCDPDQSDCQHCENLQPHHLNQWRRYIDALLQNFKDEEGNSIYYKQIREQPFCCKPKAGEFCSIKLINEPKLPPHRLYELGCRGQGDFWNSITCAPGGARCCNATFCNLPTDEEISKLIVEKPKDNTLIVILPILFVLTAFVLIGGWCFWRWRDRTDWRKSLQMPVSVVGGPIGDCAGQTSGGDTCPWLVDGASGVGVVVSAGTGPGGAPAQLLNGGLIEPHYPSRTPLLTGNPGSSISSSAVMIKPIRPMGGSSYHSNGLNSIGSGVIIGGSTVVRGSEGVGVGGGGGGGASYTAALASSGGGTMFPPASCSAPPGGGPDLGITSSGSGSGAGQPLLVERTVARQVHLERRIGEGRYGDVWLGRLHCDQVAVKIFSSRNENSWIREKEIYETATLRHTNILGFIAADNKDNGISTELWLIAEYHRLGSLYEFLQSHAFSLPALVKMASSIANGLAHLHMPIIGTSGKPQIAHRDLKSRNILVKGDGECCIGDLGFAVKLDSLTGQVDVAHNPERVGTKRYMAPEVLDNTLRANSFDAYMQADIYSLGLVFWEMTRRVYVPDLYGPEEYQLPYQDYVGSDPLVEEMKSVVCELGLRPHLPLVWQKDSTLRMLYHIMTECWFATPSDRLSAMRIKKDLGNQRQQLGPPGQASDSVLPPHILRQQSPSHVLPPGVFLFRSPEPTPSSPATTTAAATAKQATPSTVDGLQPATPLLTSVQPPNVIAATQPNVANC